MAAAGIQREGLIQDEKTGNALDNLNYGVVIIDFASFVF